MINQTSGMDTVSVNFTRFWEEHCKEQVENSYVSVKNESIFSKLSRNDNGEIVGHNLPRGAVCCVQSVNFWLSCK